VDAFLERRPEFLGVGKLAIAYCLIPLEDEAKLYQPTSSRGGGLVRIFVGKTKLVF
jgi:hypothetical protein